MKTLHLLIVTITTIYLIHTLPIDAQCYGCGQNSSALKKALATLSFCNQHFDHGPTLGETIGMNKCENQSTLINYHGVNLTVINIINKTTFGIGENITVTPELLNHGNRNVTVSYCGPLFVTLTTDESNKIVSPQYSWACPLFDNEITLKPNVPTPGESYGHVITLHDAGNYTIQSIASFADPPNQVILWSEPVGIAVVSEKTPEFPFAIPVLLIGITSLIIFSKMKIRI
ncbi:MAG: hypothetical protein KGH87_00855 [Thaumarchaeota archaeon]|nr:hypothetical protein [Nitrososphaerota archaeon]MDE1838444.1 hypothetical protein [Nitrososphaerota archaeon]